MGAVIQLGSPADDLPSVLRILPRLVHFDGDDVGDIAARLRAAMGNHHYAHGIAAPQIGIPVRAFALRMNVSDQLRLFFNPQVTSQSNTKNDFREGCLSLPGYRGMVRRAKRITITALDSTGATFSHRAYGYESAVIQHELDHLDGIWYWHKLVEGTELIEATR